MRTARISKSITFSGPEGDYRVATMLPPSIPEDVSPAERRVFEMLKTDVGARDWVVLHSLGLAHRRGKPYGEIDFVVLVPNQGVVCIEVKGGRVRCENGVWYTMDRTDREHRLKRSPFQQAREGMFALKDYVGRQSSSKSIRALFSYAVVLPDVDRLPSTPEFEEWEAVDRSALSRPISKCLIDNLAQQRRKLGVSYDLESRHVGRLKALLRPDFDRLVGRSTTIALSEERHVRLTEQQFAVLDMLRTNNRCVVEGPAGTGKTLLALAAAKEALEAGGDVALICYNRVLARWLKDQLASYSKAVVGGFFQCVREVIVTSTLGRAFEREEAGSDRYTLFRTVFPQYALAALAESETTVATLLVDEAQDLIAPQYLSVINAWVRGGLSTGNWAFFGDFTRQSIYGGPLPQPSVATVRETMQEFAHHFAVLPLRLNCRNTTPIAEETALLSGFEASPYRYPDGEGLAVDYRYWKSREDQTHVLCQVLGDLHSDGVASSDVVVLSTRTFADSACSQLPVPWRARIHQPREDDWRGPSGSLSSLSIHAFKGMESPVVILTDVVDISSDAAASLIYVRMSRARSHLVILLADSLRGAVAAALKRKLTMHAQ